MMEAWFDSVLRLKAIIGDNIMLGLFRDFTLIMHTIWPQQVNRKSYRLVFVNAILIFMQNYIKRYDTSQV